MRIIKTIICSLFLLFISCNKITSGDHLRKDDIQRIEGLGILDENEKIIKFYSEYKKNVAGNFFTDKRIASYWIERNSKQKSKIKSAFYSDIININTNINPGTTYSPYLEVMCKDSTTFKVSFDGEKDEIQNTFNEAISIWKSNKK